MTLPIRSLHHVVFCAQWEACAAFYGGTLGLPETDRRDGFVEFAVAPGACIGLIDVADRPGYGDPSRTPGLLALQTDDIHTLHRRLSSRLAALPRIRRHPWGALVFEISDPEGRRIEFWQTAPRLRPRKGH